MGDLLADAVVRETLFFVVVSTSGLVAGYQVRLGTIPRYTVLSLDALSLSSLRRPSSLLC